MFQSWQLFCGRHAAITVIKAVNISRINKEGDSLSGSCSYIFGASCSQHGPVFELDMHKGFIPQMLDRAHNAF